MAKSKTSFSATNQPTNRGKNGRKKGVKVGSIQVYKYLNAKIVDTVQKTTQLSTKQYLEIINTMLTMDDTSLDSISTDHIAPRILRTVANELMNTERSTGFIERTMDRLAKMQSIESETLQIELDYKPIQELENAEKS